ncbi:hypothetical protein DTO271D3_5388 [Paecilomyces variotii]|nr:hypothetical protein DTO032I3_1259 [Paecilomyces variotii]KAJ9245062.1 hypothetical protein DTO169E5_929 [Paecilomyces variotii]KAJ9277737.1 hypothetical protein DTO021D3_5320 [Paecilomyces variotii]KAJ9314411.1 hypothetical protein DTO271D3_5388 [Paecilomyces variotii]KAJ9325997.1 hypothetical protein DTO027B3_2973 [Paecilomyces variotii]
MELMPQAAEMEGEGDGEKQREKAISPSSSRPGQVSLRRILHRNIISHPPHPGEPSLLLLSSTSPSSASQVPLLLCCGCGSSSRPLPVASATFWFANCWLVARINKKHGRWVNTSRATRTHLYLYPGIIS